MVFWEKVQDSYFNKQIAELQSGDEASIVNGGKYCEAGMIAVYICGKHKIYPHTVRNFNTEDECKKFVDEYVAAKSESLR